MASLALIDCQRNHWVLFLAGRSEAPISCPENRHRNAPALCLERRQVSDRTGHHSNPPLTDVDKRHDR